MSIFNRPIYNKMITQLYKQYHRDVDTPEHHTGTELRQQYEFVDLLLGSRIIKRLHQFFICHRKLSVKLTGVVAHWQKLRYCFRQVTFRTNYIRV